MGSSIESVTQIGYPQGSNRTTESLKVRFQCEVMGAQQSSKRKGRTTSRTSRTSLTSRTSSTSRGGGRRWTQRWSIGKTIFNPEKWVVDMNTRRHLVQRD